MRGQCPSELSIIKMTISVSIVTLEEKIHVVCSHMNPDICQSMLHVFSCDLTQTIDVKNAECILCVKIRSHNSLIFDQFNFLVQMYLFANHLDDTSLRLMVYWKFKATSWLLLLVLKVWCSSTSFHSCNRWLSLFLTSLSRANGTRNVSLAHWILLLWAELYEA